MFPTQKSFQSQTKTQKLLRSLEFCLFCETNPGLALLCSTINVFFCRFVRIFPYIFIMIQCFRLSEIQKQVGCPWHDRVGELGQLWSSPIFHAHHQHPQFFTWPWIWGCYFDTVINLYGVDFYIQPIIFTISHINPILSIFKTEPLLFGSSLNYNSSMGIWQQIGNSRSNN